MKNETKAEKIIRKEIEKWSILKPTSMAECIIKALTEANLISSNTVLPADSPLTIEAIDFGNWLGFHYYRVAGWKWRQIKDESDLTEYPLVVLYDKFKRETKR